MLVLMFRSTLFSKKLSKREYFHLGNSLELRPNQIEFQVPLGLLLTLGFIKFSYSFPVYVCIETSALGWYSQQLDHRRAVAYHSNYRSDVTVHQFSQRSMGKFHQKPCISNYRRNSWRKFSCATALLTEHPRFHGMTTWNDIRDVRSNYPELWKHRLILRQMSVGMRALHRPLCDHSTPCRSRLP